MATKAITAFSFAGLVPVVVSTINDVTKTIALTVPYGVAVTALVPTITHNGVSIDPLSGVAADFTSPITYIVTAEDASTQDYVVTVISSLTLLKQYLQLGADDVSRDTLIMGMWDGAIETIENELGYSISPHTASYQVPGNIEISLSELISSALVVKYRNDLTDTTGTTDTTLTPWVDYYPYARHIELLSYRCTDPRIIISYVSGWSSLPAPLEQAARMLVAYQLLLVTTAQPGTFIDKRIPADIQKILEPYLPLTLP